MELAKLDTIQDDPNKLRVEATIAAVSDPATETTLALILTDTNTIAGDTTSIDAKLPAALGAAAAAGSLSTVPSDPTVTTTLNAAAMSADATSAAGIDLGSCHRIFVRVTTAQGAGAPDHVGVLKFLAGATNVVGDAKALAVPQLDIAAGAEVDETIEFTTYALYLWAWYDRTSGGDDDTITVIIAHSQ